MLSSIVIVCTQLKAFKYCYCLHTVKGFQVFLQNRDQVILQMFLLLPRVYGSVRTEKK